MQAGRGFSGSECQARIGRLAGRDGDKQCGLGAGQNRLHILGAELLEQPVFEHHQAFGIGELGRLLSCAERVHDLQRERRLDLFLTREFGCEAGALRMAGNRRAIAGHHVHFAFEQFRQAVALGLETLGVLTGGLGVP